MPAEAADPLKLLVVDDSHDMQRSIATLLSPIRGLRIVGCAEDVAGALERVERLRPDLILLDVALRGQDRGIDVLRPVVRQHPRIRVIVLSNFGWRALRDGLLDAGAHACFEKGTGFMQARDWIAALAQSHADGPRPGAC